MAVLKIVAPGMATFFGLHTLYGAFYATDVKDHERLPLALLGAVVLIGTTLYYRFISRFADSVMDHGDHLVVRRGRVSQTIPFADILTISESFEDKTTRRAEIYLAKPGPFGTQITFYTSFVSHPYTHTADPTIRSLRERIERASREAS